MFVVEFTSFSGLQFTTLSLEKRFQNIVVILICYFFDMKNEGSVSKILGT